MHSKDCLSHPATSFFFCFGSIIHTGGSLQFSRDENSLPQEIGNVFSFSVSVVICQLFRSVSVMLAISGKIDDLLSKYGIIRANIFLAFHCAYFSIDVRLFQF